MFDCEGPWVHPRFCVGSVLLVVLVFCVVFLDLFVIILFLVCQVLLVSLDCSLLIVPSVFPNVYDLFKVSIVQLDMDKKKLLGCVNNR
jgi:hypothetical protein